MSKVVKRKMQKETTVRNYLLLIFFVSFLVCLCYIRIMRITYLVSDEGGMVLMDLISILAFVEVSPVSTPSMTCRLFNLLGERVPSSPKGLTLSSPKMTFSVWSSKGLV